MIRALLTITTDNLQHVESRMLLLGRKNSQERVAAFLLEMNVRLKATGGMALPMSRRDIADYLGLTLETVSRALSEFKRKGYLRFLGSTQRQIVVLKPAGLGEMDTDVRVLGATHRMFLLRDTPSDWRSDPLGASLGKTGRANSNKQQF